MCLRVAFYRGPELFCVSMPVSMLHQVFNAEGCMFLTKLKRVCQNDSHSTS